MLYCPKRTNLFRAKTAKMLYCPKKPKKKQSFETSRPWRRPSSPNFGFFGFFWTVQHFCSVWLKNIGFFGTVRHFCSPRPPKCCTVPKKPSFLEHKGAKMLYCPKNTKKNQSLESLGSSRAWRSPNFGFFFGFFWSQYSIFACFRFKIGFIGTVQRFWKPWIIGVPTAFGSCCNRHMLQPLENMRTLGCRSNAELLFRITHHHNLLGIFCLGISSRTNEMFRICDKTGNYSHLHAFSQIISRTSSPNQLFRPHYPAERSVKSSRLPASRGKELLVLGPVQPLNSQSQGCNVIQKSAGFMQHHAAPRPTQPATTRVLRMPQYPIQIAARSRGAKLARTFELCS